MTYYSSKLPQYAQEILKELLSRVLEVSDDAGTATGGSDTTVIDTVKNWDTNMWAGATVHVIHASVEYIRVCSANTADTLTIGALPVGISATAGDAYAIRRALTIADISDRAARLLGVIDSVTKWGGVALTGRDISLDLANLNLTLTALRDAICAISPNNKTLNDLHARLAETLTRDISDGAGRILGQITDGTSAISPAAFGSGTHPRNITTWGGTALTGRDISSDIARLDIALSALRDAICAAGAEAKTLNDLYTRILEVQQNVYSQLIGADETVAQSITLDVAGRTLLDIYASASVAATFRLDVSNDNTNWISDYLTWAAVTEVKETHTNAFRYLRLKSDAAGAAGDLVSLYLTGGR